MEANIGQRVRGMRTRGGRGGRGRGRGGGEEVRGGGEEEEGSQEH